MARERNKLVTCFLEPTELIPPFNLTHTEDLTAWAGQEFDTGWLKILERIGELVDRPGLSTYYAVMRPSAAVQELRTWALANGSDPLVGAVWERIEQLEGESARQRIEREKAEARARDKQRKVLSTRSRRLARTRGLRNPRLERRRWLALLGTVVGFALLLAGWIGYTVDQGRRQKILDGVTQPEDLRRFISANAWHPVAGTARKRLERLDDAAWIEARIDGSIEAVNRYISTYKAGPFRHQQDAADTLEKANEIQDVQAKLLRLGMYKGPTNGALNSETKAAVRLFRARTGLVVSSIIDGQLRQTLDRKIEIWISPKPDDLKAEKIDPPTETELVDLAGRLQVDIPTLLAVQAVESGSKGGFWTNKDEEARPTIVFEPHIFSRLTGHKFDESHPQISSLRWNRKLYPRSQAERWRQLESAFSLDPEAGYKSISIGRFQIMGLNAERIGYESVGEYIRNMSQSETKQFEALFLFADKNKLAQHLQNRNWTEFAHRYNGPGIASQFAAKLQAAYDKYATIYSQKLPWKHPIMTNQGTANPDLTTRRLNEIVL